MIVLDASVWVASLLTDEPRHQEADLWLHDWMQPGRRLVVPRLFIVEVGGSVARRRDPLEGALAIRRVRTEPLVDVRDQSNERWSRAADLASKLRLRAADAVYVAMAEELRLPLVTWDQEILDRASDVIDVRTPNQMPI